MVLETYCNPMNIEYKLQMKKKNHHLFREAADPSVRLINGTYYLFPSMSGGYYTSSNMKDWIFHQDQNLPIYDYAPDISVIDGELYFTASKATKKCEIYKSPNTLPLEWTLVGKPLVYWDPNLFQDSDGRIYAYWGCSNFTPIYGIELSSKFKIIGKKQALFDSNMLQHGFERPGGNNQVQEASTLKQKMVGKIFHHKPFIEGAWMNKVNGQYYLQYAAPGTEFNIYADGVYVSFSPLGPFSYQTHNPFSLKPSGFINGAGHGSTFLDAYGNLWHTSTMSISMNDHFERRIGLFPAGIDQDGILFCNTAYGDYPTLLPTHKWDPLTDSFASSMLLSFHKKVEASSEEINESAKNITDENVKTVWAASSDDLKKEVIIDLGMNYLIKHIQVNFSEVNLTLKEEIKTYYRDSTFTQRVILNNDQPYRYHLYASRDKLKWTDLFGEIENHLSHHFISLENSEEYRYIKMVNEQMPYNGQFALSGLRIFGHGNSALPHSVTELKMERLNDFEVNLSWEKDDLATGYVVYFGIEPTKLYSSWMVYQQNEVMITSLNKDQSYYFMVESFNESGRTKGNVFYLD